MKKVKKSLLFSSVSAALVATPVVTTACSASAHDTLINNLKSVQNPNGTWTNVDYYSTPSKNYHVYLRNSDLANYLTSGHSKAQVSELQTKLHDTITYQVTEYNTEKYGKQYFIPAAQISSEGAASYTSIWVRDSVWNILALKAQGRTDDANNCSKSLFQYFRTANQIQRIKNVLNDPYILLESKGAMNGVHIRFDAHTLEDVQEDGHDQYWSHKQNDALGLFLSLLVEFAKEHLGDTTLWPGQDEDMKTIVRLVTYLNYVDYVDMEDSGAWEEVEKIACSSVACVTSAFNAVQLAYGDGTTKFAIAYEKARSALTSEDKKFYDWSGIEDDAAAESTGIKTAIKNAYLKTIKVSIEKGGESVRYPQSDEEYREADTAMLCLIYPYKLPDYAYVDEQHPENNFTYDVLSKIKILSIVENNNNDYGIIRYKDDNYQCSDYWFYDIPADVSEESHKKRKEIFISGSEASWFFDSWMAICYAKVLEELLPLQDETYTNYKLWAFNKLHYHINKALAFVDKAGAYRSDGTKTTEASLPESYTVVTKNRNDNSTAWYRLASPVDPLRWAQSSMILMLDVLSKIGDNIIPQTLPTN